MKGHYSEPDPAAMERGELRDYLRTHPTVTLWPFCGRALGLSRSLAYQCGRGETIKVLRLGHTCRVPSAWLETLLFGDQ